jgi:hypothetical protein
MDPVCFTPLANFAVFFSTLAGWHTSLHHDISIPTMQVQEEWSVNPAPW